MREWWQRGLTRQLDRLRSSGRATLLWSLRITIAAVASYVVATLLFPGTQPLLAPLTAMLVVQVTPVSLLASGVDRVVAVVAGVSLAVGFAEVVPLQWWSLGVLILVALVIGEALRLRANLIEVAISGMLVLGVGSFDAQSAAWQRLAETLVGAAVGVLANLLFPPKPASASASREIEGLAGSISNLLTRAADELASLAEDGRDLTAAARSWLGESRRITHDIPPVGAALLHAEQGRRLNVRAVGTPDTGPGLRQGLEALEHSAVAVRGLFSSLVEATYDAEWPSDESADDVLLGLAQTFREMAQAVATFGRLVRGEADPAHRAGPEEVYAVREALEGLHEARARLDELVTADTGPQLLRLHAAVLSTVQRLLREMDIDERVRRQVRLGRATGLRRPRPVPRAGHDRPPQPEPTPEAETQVLPPVPPNRRGRRRP